MTAEEQSEKTAEKNPMELTFKDVEVLNRYVTDTGKILPRKYTRLTSAQQRHVARVVKQARAMLLMK